MKVIAHMLVYTSQIGEYTLIPVALYWLHKHVFGIGLVGRPKVGTDQKIVIRYEPV